jgi:trehalose-6-phosphate synthase
MAADGSAGDAPLLVLTNRLPFVLQRGREGLERRPAAGGLVSALDPVLQKRGAREALLVNPYDVEKTADQLHRALTMSASERRARMDALQDRERRNDVHSWVASFLRAASSAPAPTAG